MPAVPSEYLCLLGATEVLEQLHPIDSSGWFVRNPERWPGFMQGALVAYERLCLKAIEFAWHRSLLQALIRS